MDLSLDSAAFAISAVGTVYVLQWFFPTEPSLLIGVACLLIGFGLTVISVYREPV